jgi:membrane protease YdiL (CAAX protease family)
VGIIINEVIIIAGLPFILALIFHFDLKQLFPLQRPKTAALILAALLTLPFAFLIDYGAAVTEVLFPLPASYYSFLEQLMSFTGAAGFLHKLFLLCILPGFCEEILFRGFCQNSLEIKWGTNKAILITGLLFALLHGNPWYLPLYFLLGIFLSWVYALSRTLWVPIVCHTLNNAWTFSLHSLDLKIPFRAFADPLDIVLVLAAVILVVTLALAYRRSSL